MIERRYALRKSVELPVKLRILTEDDDIGKMRLSSAAEAHIRDLGLRGLGLTTPNIIIDGIHIDHLEATQPKPKIYLQWFIPELGNMTAVAETVWCEQFRSSPERLFHIGLRFIDLSKEYTEMIKGFLTAN